MKMGIGKGGILQEHHFDLGDILSMYYMLTVKVIFKVFNLQLVKQAIFRYSELRTSCG